MRLRYRLAITSGRTWQPRRPEATRELREIFPRPCVARPGSPVLFIHGDDDRNVPFDQATDLVQRLRRQGTRLEEIVYPDEIHDLLLWRSWVDAYRATAAFFAREL